MDNFCYQPLDGLKDSFRLLRLRKGETAKVECEIFHSSMAGQSSIEYEALSYVWGNDDLVDRIEANGRALWITETLFSALSHLRYLDQDRILWIDAICIDQANNVEKSSQVQAMGEIFRSAKQVIFWLGRPTREATLLINSLNGLETQHDFNLTSGETGQERKGSSVELGLEVRREDLLFRQRKGLQSLL